jgi:hypothetical protein
LGRFSILTLAYAIGLSSCAAPARDGWTGPVPGLPLSVQGRDLSLRGEVRELTPHSVNLVIYLIVSATIPRVSVDVSSTNPLLHVSPAGCVLSPLAPPVVVHTTGPPYPLPAVPLCSFVLSASDHAIYPVLLRVRDANGVDLVKPIATAVAIKGST